MIHNYIIWPLSFDTSFARWNKIWIEMVNLSPFEKTMCPSSYHTLLLHLHISHMHLYNKPFLDNRLFDVLHVYPSIKKPKKWTKIAQRHLNLIDLSNSSFMKNKKKLKWKGFILLIICTYWWLVVKYIYNWALGVIWQSLSLLWRICTICWLRSQMLIWVQLFNEELLICKLIAKFINSWGFRFYYKLGYIHGIKLLQGFLVYIDFLIIHHPRTWHFNYFLEKLWFSFNIRYDVLCMICTRRAISP